MNDQVTAWNVSLLVKGLPIAAGPDEISSLVTRAIQLPITKVTPINPNASDDTAAASWLVRLRSQEDRKLCTSKCTGTSSTILHEGRQLMLKFTVPEMSMIPKEDEWIPVSPNQYSTECISPTHGRGSQHPDGKGTGDLQPGMMNQTPDKREQFFYSSPPYFSAHPQTSPYHNPGYNQRGPEYNYHDVGDGYARYQGPGEAGPTGYMRYPGFSPHMQATGYDINSGMMPPGSATRGAAHCPIPPTHNPAGWNQYPYPEVSQNPYNPLFQHPPPPYSQINKSVNQEPREDERESYHMGELNSEGDDNQCDLSSGSTREDMHSDFVVLDSESGLGEEFNPNSMEGKRNFFLRVTELPSDVTKEELIKFFEDRKRSGGGKVKHVEIDLLSNIATVKFWDSDTISRVIQRTPLLLKGKKIQVDLQSSHNDSEKEDDEWDTVEIHEVMDEGFAEMCEYYFSNPSKGGGEIKERNWDEEQHILYITFMDAQVAQQVVSMEPTLKGRSLTVKLHIPPPEKEEEECTVEVRGFDPSNEELYKLYFENPKRGGEIADMKMSEDQSVLYITFETPEVADKVASVAHAVGGRELQVNIAPKEEILPCSVMVKGADLKQQDLYMMYFENPKYGGGTIISITPDSKQDAILITFEDPEVAKTVCSQSHTVGGRHLDVSIHVTRPAKSKSKEPNHDESEAEAPIKTVVVNVGTNMQSDDTYLFYFENPRYGGGEVVEVNKVEDKGLVFITFKDPQVAERVAEKSHKISGQQVEVKLYIPPKPRPTYPNKLLFRNVQESTTKDCLLMFVERITGLEPLDAIYGDEPGVVLISFEKTPDFDKVQSMCQNKTLEGRQLTVSRVPISNCIVVENLSPRVTEDTLQLYFESKRSNGGSVERVEMELQNKRCYIYFEDHEVIEQVLSKKHILEGQEVKVARYLECLGTSGGSSDPTAFTLPKPLRLEDLDRFKVGFIRQSDTAKKAFFKELSLCHAKATFDNSILVVECTLTQSVANARLLAKTWPSSVKENVQKYLSLISVDKLQIMNDIWPETEKAVSGINNDKRDAVVMFTLSEERTFVVVGMISPAKQFFDQISKTVQAIESEFERKKQEVSENNKLKLFQLRLLSATAFPSETAKQYEKLQIEIRTKKLEIHFHGLYKDVKDAQIAMYNKLQAIRSDKITNLTDMQRQLLDMKETRKFVVGKFKEKKITAVWEVNQDVLVYAFTDDDLVRAIHIIKDSIVEHVRPLDSESIELLRSSEWMELVKGLVTRHPGLLKIVPAHDNQQIFITGISDIMHGVLEDVEQFLSENTIYINSFAFSPSRQKLVSIYMQNELMTLAKSLRAYKVNITLSESGDKICVRGIAEGLKQVQIRLGELENKIICHVERIADHSKVKFLTSEKCAKELDMIGSNQKCILALEEEPAGLKVLEMGSSKTHIKAQHMGDFKTMASAQLRNGVSVTAVLGDITEMSVDAIVNAANSRLDHIGGLAGEILRKGGQEIQKECHAFLKTHKNKELSEGEVMESGPGHLPCKTIIHAVGPLYNGGRSGEEDILHDVVVACLDTVNKRQYSSIAIPAISSGIFHYPVAESTRVIVESLKEYLETHRRNFVKMVYLCDVLPDTVQHFSNAIQKFFPTTASHPVKASNKPSVSFKPGSSQKSVGSWENMKLVIVEGEIAKERADVIINSTSNGLDLRNGAVSSSILKEAGQELQKECQDKYPNGIQNSVVAVTNGYSLKCKKVYHVALCNWSNPNAEQELGQMMQNCLKKASDSKYESVAFPALGTGNLGYPREVVAGTMLGAVNEFQNRNSSTSLREVKMVIYPTDTETVKQFKNFQQQMGLPYIKGKSTPSRSATDMFKSSQKRKDRKFSDDTLMSIKPVVGGNSANVEFDIGGLRLIIKQGDITEEKVDAIVNSSNKSLDLSRGAVAVALRDKGGKGLQKECKGKVEDMVQFGIATTKGHKIKSKLIFHLDAEKFNQQWEDGVTTCLEEAEKHQIQSLAVPAFGTGAYGLSPAQSAMALFNALIKFCHKKARGLCEVRVLLFEKTMIPEYVGAIQTLGENLNSKSSGFFGFFRGLVGYDSPKIVQTSSGVVSEDSKSVTLVIYCTNKECIPQILKEIDDIVKEKFTRKNINDPVLQELNESEIEKIFQIGVQNNVEINLQKPLGKIVLDGLHANILDAYGQITSILRDAERSRQDMIAAQMLIHMVQWSFLEVTATGTEKREYPAKVNHIIEQAFQKKERSVNFTDIDGNTYTLDFDSMKEYPAGDSTDTVDVIRTDKIKDMASGIAMLPTTWTAHSSDEPLRREPLQAGSSEYNEVESNFKSTLGNIVVTILGIERIQNPTLYRQYIAKKTHLEKQNTGTNVNNEMTLWHGTAADAIQNINNYGFNRSYCGKNATAYGQGVYFAINSNYSAHATYSPPDPSGKRYIYMCKVLVGHSCNGNTNMRVLPSRLGDVMYDSATNNTTTPQMYVIFHDTQAYPEYLITFQ